MSERRENKDRTRSGLFVFRSVVVQDRRIIKAAQATVKAELGEKFRAFSGEPHITLLPRTISSRADVSQALYPHILQPLPATANRSHVVKPTSVNGLPNSRGERTIAYNFELPDSLLLTERRHFQDKFTELVGRRRSIARWSADVHIVLGWAHDDAAAAVATEIFQALRPESLALNPLHYHPRSIERIVAVSTHVPQEAPPRQPIPADFLAVLHRAVQAGS